MPSMLGAPRYSLTRNAPRVARRAIRYSIDCVLDGGVFPSTSDKTPTRLTNQAVRPPLKRKPRGPLRLSGFETYTTHMSI